MYRIEVEMPIGLKLSWKIAVIALLLVISLPGFYGCGDDPEAGGEKITISSVTPSEAGAGDVVTIEGTGFSSDPLKNVVAFSAEGVTNSRDSRIAIPTSSTGGSLTVTVPEGAYTGGVRVESRLSGFGFWRVVPPEVIVGHGVVGLPRAFDKHPGRNLGLVPAAPDKPVAGHQPSHDQAVLFKGLAAVS